MARIRTIKPSFFKSEDVSQLPLRTRLTWIGLWTQCDDHGRTKDNVQLIKADVWPLDDVTLRDVTIDLNTLADRGLIARYETGGSRYLAVVNWHEHQKVNRPTKSRIPPPPVSVGTPAPGEDGHCESCWLADQTATAHAPLTEDSRQEGKGKEGKGGDARTREGPPRNCEQHRNTPNPPPCGPCGDARRSYETWHANKRQRQRDGTKCATHPGQLADTCSGCAGDRKAVA